MNDRGAFDAFAAKWRARWPEWGVAEVFVPPARREAAVAWFALLDELTDAAWTGDDAAPGLAKLAWWQDELRGWAKGARRHPLGAVLQPRAAPWQALADALPVLRDRGLPARGVAAATEALRPLGAVVAQVEAALFDGVLSQDQAMARALLAPYAAHREEKDAEPPAAPLRPATRERRLLSALMALRARGTGHAQPRRVARWRVLPAAWRAARN